MAGDGERQQKGKKEMVYHNKFSMWMLQHRWYFKMSTAKKIKLKTTSHEAALFSND